jgi:hypothetical protein
VLEFICVKKNLPQPKKKQQRRGRREEEEEYKHENKCNIFIYLSVLLFRKYFYCMFCSESDLRFVDKLPFP